MNRPALRNSGTGTMLAHHKFWLTIVALAAGCAPLVAQQPYSPYGVGEGQYAAPNQPYGYGQPQFSQPQFNQPQYSQPQYGQPQYSQPQPYAQQPVDPQEYGQPQYQPPPQYEQPQYSQPQPYAQQQPVDPQQYGQAQYGQQQQPLNADQLEQLVAPIALYPDQLLAQILTASTYPAQVAVANQWLEQMQAQGAATADQIAAGADAQANWDPSVKALTAFPQVLDMMDQNLQWTTNLGNAYYNQPQDIMQTVQVLRQRAEDAGNLESTPQEQMTYDQGAIELAPANPQMVYVPVYDPWDAYGQPVAPYPGFSLVGALGSFFGGAFIHYGPGIAMAAFDRMPWGGLAWGLDWLGHEIFFHHDAYFTHSTTVADWGFPRGGARAYGGWARDLRFAGAGRVAQSYARSGYENPRSQTLARPTPQFTRPVTRPAEGFTANQRSQYPAQSYGAARPAMPTQQAYNRVPQPISRPQAYAASPYAASPYAARPEAYGYANRTAQTYAARPGGMYASPTQTLRAPQAAAPRAYAQEPSRGLSAFSSAPQRPGSYQNFGGKAPKSFGGGSEHFKVPKAPRESHSGGGGGKHRR